MDEGIKKQPKILGIITARGSSKRLPRKNIKNFLGKPLLVWSIEVGKESGMFDRFILSTDDTEIADIGKAHGIDVPFMRPAQHAQDTSKSFDVVKHAHEWLRDNDNFDADYIVLLEPTSPGRQVYHIQEVVEKMRDNTIDSLMGISKLPAHLHPHKVVRTRENETIVKHHSNKLIRESEIRNQDFSPVHFTNSAIYAFKPANFYAQNPSLWGDSVHGYMMDEKYAIDIDTQEDWDLAELKMQILLEKNKKQ